MRIHFIAIGGSAMHNLAIALHEKGDFVTGSDDEIFEPSKSRLHARGLLPDKFGWDEGRISSDIDAVILGMHARLDNPELLKAQELGLKIYSYPEFLYEQSKNKRRVVIAGSHGKTTITSMVLHVLKYAGLDADFMVGAQLEGFNVMVKLSDYAQWMVMEGDEYLTSPIDRRPKFLHYHPHIAVISGIGWDHVNVFPKFEMYVDQFRQLIAHLDPNGSLIYYQQDEEVRKIADEFAGEKVAYQAQEAITEEGHAKIVDENGNLYPIKVFGNHNLANLKAAFHVCKIMGISSEIFFLAIQSFAGASRRLEELAAKNNNYFFRDFAHAPSKLKASVAALRHRFPEHKLLICYELHTYSSMSESFIDHYYNTLSPADAAAVFYDPHAVSLKKLPLMSDERIENGFGGSVSVIHHSTELVDFLKREIKADTVIALMSSGSFGGIDISGLLQEIGF